MFKIIIYYLLLDLCYHKDEFSSQVRVHIQIQYQIHRYFSSTFHLILIHIFKFQDLISFLFKFWNKT